MQEERLMILQMLQDGKITAEEAAELLKALDGEATHQPSEKATGRYEKGSTPSGEVSADRTCDRSEQLSNTFEKKVHGFVEQLIASIGKVSVGVKQQPGSETKAAACNHCHPSMEKATEDGSIQSMEAFADRAVDAAEQLSSTIENKVHGFVQQLEKEQEEGGSLFTTWLQKLSQGGLSGLMGGPKWEFEEVLEGEFVDGGDPVLDLTTYNGRIEVAGWDQAGYRLRLLKTVRAQDEEEARQIATEMLEIVQERSALRVKPKQQSIPGHQGAALYLHVPRALCYQIALTTYNGRIEVAHLLASQVAARTANGRIEALGVQAESMSLKTANGRIELGCVCPDLEARTSNGRITLRSGGGNGCYQLKTSNGAISVFLPVGQDCGYSLQASTSNSKIEASLPDLEFTVDERKKPGRKCIVAKTGDFERYGDKVHITADTSNGSIYIGQAEEDGA